jgi:hypothetical protein
MGVLLEDVFETLLYKRHSEIVGCDRTLKEQLLGVSR